MSQTHLKAHTKLSCIMIITPTLYLQLPSSQHSIVVVKYRAAHCNAPYPLSYTITLSSCSFKHSCLARLYPHYHYSSTIPPPLSLLLLLVGWFLETNQNTDPVTSSHHYGDTRTLVTRTTRTPGLMCRLPYNFTCKTMIVKCACACVS